LASGGVASAVSGRPEGWLTLLVPLFAAVVAAGVVGRLADAHYCRTTAILTEVDGMYAGIEEGGLAGDVYLQRFGCDNPELLRALRQGWRRLRPYPLSAWGIGFLAGLMVLRSSSAGVMVGGAGVFLMGVVASLSAHGDPVWLNAALGVCRRKVWFARFVVGLLYGQGAALPLIAAGFLKIGLKFTYVALVLEGVAIFSGLFGAWCAHRFSGRGVWVYGPVAFLVWIVVFGL